jgi:hypothetical protein
MRVRQTLRPGQRGTRRFTARYGERLVCVRYRYDAATQRRRTTVERIVDAARWTPSVSALEDVGVQVRWGEAALARRVKDARGRWDRARMVWRLPLATAEHLGLADRLVSLRGSPDIETVSTYREQSLYPVTPSQQKY